MKLNIPFSGDGVRTLQSNIFCERDGNLLTARLHPYQAQLKSNQKTMPMLTIYLPSISSIAVSYLIQKHINNPHLSLGLQDCPLSIYPLSC